VLVASTGFGGKAKACRAAKRCGSAHVGDLRPPCAMRGGGNALVWESIAEGAGRSCLPGTAMLVALAKYNLGKSHPGLS
jgi:hypothetical protein